MGKQFFEKLRGHLESADSSFEGFVRGRVSDGGAALEIVKSGRFLFVFLIVFLFLSFIVGLVPLQFVEKPIADSVLFYLEVKGISGEVFFGEAVSETGLVEDVVFIELVNGLKIQISYLCTGLLELIVLISAMIASLGISWRKRLLGIGVGIVLTQVFNFFRIAFTIDFILGNNSMQVIEFVHDFLFRLTLLLVIVGIYTVWFYWATTRNAQNN